MDKKIPPLKIYGFEYDIVFNDGPNGGSYVGYVRFAVKRIVIETHSGEYLTTLSYQAHTLLHEIMHCIIEHVTLGLKESEEVCCDWFGYLACRQLKKQGSVGDLKSFYNRCTFKQDLGKDNFGILCDVFAEVEEDNPELFKLIGDMLK